MSLVTTARHTVATSIHNLLRGAPSTAERRQAFKQEFDFYPSGSEATETERTVFAREAVRPVLVQRAQAIDQLGQEATGTNHPRVTTASRNESQAAFTRAYRLATALKLADKGLTYRDFLVAEVRPSQESVIV